MKIVKMALASAAVGCLMGAILGFVVPIVGLILYLIWAQTRPKSAKMVGLGALVGFIFSIVVSIIYFVVLFALLSTNSTVSILV